MDLSYFARPHSRAHGINHRLRNSVDPQRLFNRCISQRHGAKWGQAQPRGGQAKRLAHMSSFRQNHAIGSGVFVFPLRAREHGRQEDHERRIREVLLPCQRIYRFPVCPGLCAIVPAGDPPNRNDRFPRRCSSHSGQLRTPRADATLPPRARSSEPGGPHREHSPSPERRTTAIAIVPGNRGSRLCWKIRARCASAAILAGIPFPWSGGAIGSRVDGDISS